LAIFQSQILYPLYSFLYSIRIQKNRLNNLQNKISNLSSHFFQSQKYKLEHLGHNVFF
jgi:hypothetical protein